MPVTADFRKFLPPGKAVRFLKRFREIYAPPKDAESATGTGDLGSGRPVGLALGTPVPALGWALDGTLALQCRKLFGTDGNLALKCQEKAP